MPRYRVDLETETLKGQPDESFTATVDAEDPEIAIAMVKLMALRNGCRGRVFQALCQRVDDPDPEATPDPVQCADCARITDEASPCPECGTVLCRECAEKPYAFCCFVDEPAATPEPLDEEEDAFARVVDPEMGAPAPIPAAAQRYLDDVVASEALVFTRLSDDQAAKITAIKNSLAEGCGVRLALELALATDRAQKTPAAKAHDFGRFGSADYCRRKDCQAKNQPPVNRWGCKGAA